MNNYLVATIHPWNIAQFEQYSKTIPGNWKLVTQPEVLTLNFLTTFKPDYIFFPHWSWLVDSNILEKYNCVCFHMTDVPFGRGGSPLQNLIVRGYTETKISALKMTRELDSGPIYLKHLLFLDGSALEIFKRAAQVISKMINEIISTGPVPMKQIGEITIFKRRTPEQSEIPNNLSNKQLYDFIRMLDAPSYPKAYICTGQHRLEFSEAVIDHDIVTAKVTIKNNQE